ncbi:Lysine histidine transporter 1, partial [Turnera subulata]
MVGAGVLSLPYAMAELGWGPGVAVLVLSWIITLYTLWQMVEMHEMVPGKRFDRYHELGQYAFGEKLGLYIVVPQQLIVEVGLGIVYMVTGGKSLMKVHDLVCKSCKPIKQTYFIMIFASVHFVLSHLPNFNSISGVSLAAAVMSLSYSTIAWSASIHKGVQPDVEYGYKAKTTSGTVFNFLSALGNVAFAYAGHNVVLEIQATIPSTPEKPSKKPMWRGVVVAYIVVALCYFPVALIGYWMYGNSVKDDILISLEKPVWLIAMANMFVVVHVIGSYQVQHLVCIVVGLLLMILSPIGGLRQIIIDAKTYKFYQGPGVVILILSWVITLYTLWQMVEMHEMVPGKRFDRYHELGQHAFGEKLGLYIVVPQQLICEVGVDIVYMVTGGKSLQKIYNLVHKDGGKNIKTTYWIMIFASCHFVLAHLPNFNSISGVSLAAAVMSLSYSTIAWGASVDKGRQADVAYGYKATTTSGTVFNFFTALGDVAFAYAGHNVVLEIQATIPSSPEKPSKGPMWKGVIFAYVVVALCYFPVALIGYYMFGNNVADNILISLEKPTWLIIAANAFVVVHLYAMPVFDMLETLLVKKLHFSPSWMLRFVTRNL